MFVLESLLQLSDQSFGVTLVLCKSYIDLPEMILEVIVGCLEVHDEVLLLVDVELDILDLFTILFHHLLKIIECVFSKECKLLNLCEISMILLIQVLFFLKCKCHFIDLSLHVSTHHLRSEIRKLFSFIGSS